MSALIPLSHEETRKKIARCLAIHESWVVYDSSRNMYGVPIFNGIQSIELTNLLHCGFKIYSIMRNNRVDKNSQWDIKVSIVEASH